MSAPDEHLSDDQLLSVAGDQDVGSRQVREHLGRCAECRDRYTVIHGFLDGIGAEILDSRPQCPAPEELAAMPAGAERDSPHIRTCPLCQEELRLHRELAQDRLLGFNVDAVPLTAFGGETSFVFRSAATSVRLALAEGARVDGDIGAFSVSMQVVGGEIVVSVEGNSALALVLLLTDEQVEKRVPLSSGEQRLPLSAWRWAAVILADVAEGDER